MCNFLERLLTDAGLSKGDDEEDDDIDDVDDDEDEDGQRSPKKVIAKLKTMLEPRRVECLGLLIYVF